MMANRSRVLFALMVAVVLAGSAGAQDEPPSDGAGAQGLDRAPLRVARLTFVAGAVQIQRSDNTGEDAPVLNMPLVEGTRIVAGDYGQAEIEFEDGSMVRVTPRTSLTLDSLGLEGGRSTTRMTLLGGLAYFELRKAAGVLYSVDAGGVTMTPSENATVRVRMEDSPAVFAVLTGAVRLERGEGFRAHVRAGESLRADAKDETRYFLNEQFAEESWDHWNESRDELAVEDSSRRTGVRYSYAGAQGYGWSDLDANGSWYNVPGQGQVWQPNVADEYFDPYGYGNWVWLSGGYVWASGYAWGWTPFRCGQWLFFPGFGWGWEANSRCGNWGLGFGGGDGGGGGGVLIGGSAQRPPRYLPVQTPIIGPGKVHPIIPVRGADGPRPPVMPGGIKRIAGKDAIPLQRVGGPPRIWDALGQGLNRDFPVDAKTHQPVLGVTTAEGNTPGAVRGTRTNGAEGWHAVKPGEGRGQRNEAPAAGAPVYGISRPVDVGRGMGDPHPAQAGAEHHVHSVSPPSSEPLAPPAPVRQVPVQIIQQTAPPPVRNSPPPAPSAPVHSSPPPQMPSPVASPARSESVRPESVRPKPN